MLPPRSGIFSPLILATGQLLQPFTNSAQVNLHQETVSNSVLHLWHLLLPLPATSSHKARPIQRTECRCLGNSEHQPMVGPPAGFTKGLLAVDFQLPLLVTPSFLKDTPTQPPTPSPPPCPWSCLSPGPLCPFSLFLLTLLTLKC